MSIYMQRAIDVNPFERGTDVSLDGTGFHLPEAVNVDHHHASEAASINFMLTADEGLHFDLDIHLLLPAVTPTDFLLG